MNTMRVDKKNRIPEIVFLCKLPAEAATKQYQNFVYDVEWYKNVTKVHTQTGVTFNQKTPPDQYQFELHEADWANAKEKYGHLGHNVSNSFATHTVFNNRINQFTAIVTTHVVMVFVWKTA